MLKIFASGSPNFGKVSEKCSKFSPPAVKILEKSVSEIRQKLFYFLSQKCEQSLKSRLETKGGGVNHNFMGGFKNLTPDCAKIWAVAARPKNHVFEAFYS